MLNFLFTVLIFISVILILVTVHEFGHFIIAKFFGMKVLRFSVGFGKPFWSIYDKQGTEYALAPIPLGGYVKLLDTREGQVLPEELPFAFDQRPIYQRFLVILAGPLFNFLLAFIAFWIVFTVGLVHVKPIVGNVVLLSPVAVAGMHAGDEIIAIADEQTPHWAAVGTALVLHYGEKGILPLTVRETIKGKQNQRILGVNLQNWRLNDLRPNTIKSLGIIPYIPPKQLLTKEGEWPGHLLIMERYPPLQAIGVALNETYQFTKLNVLILYKMLTGTISWRSLGGPVSIMKAAEFAAKQGIVIYFNFLAFISISIAILNILPIPGLDGSHLVYLIIEAIRGRPVSVPVQLLAFRLGIIVLCFLLIQAFLNDILRLVMG